jgi:hypothetical protein
MSQSTRRFARHYVEMVVAMLIGMAVLGLPADRALDAVGAHGTAPMLLEMAVTMTVPMVAWMRYRGHGWRASAEMSASMLLPTFAVIGLLAAGVVSGAGALMAIEHVAMFAGMFAVMLLRREEYSCAAHRPVTA